MSHPIPRACLRVLSTQRFPARQTFERTLANESARALLERFAPRGSFATLRDAGVKRGNEQPLLTAIAFHKSAAAPGGGDEPMQKMGRLDEPERSTEYLRIPLAREARLSILPTPFPVGQPVTTPEVRGQSGATATAALAPSPGGVGAHAGALGC